MQIFDFETFFKENQKTVYRIARSYVKSPDIAEDVTIEAFIKAHSQWQRVQGFENPVGYIVRIAINKAKNFLLRNKFAGMLDIFGVEIKTNRRDPEAMALLNEENSVLEAELLALKEVERTIILLKDIDGIKFDDICTALEMKLPTVKSIYRRAKLKLSMRLEEQNVL